MRNVTMDAWKELDWSSCSKTDGRILCASVGGDEDLVGHYFASPFEFDFPTVWEAIVHYLKPTQCSYQCHSLQEGERLEMIRLGTTAGRWAGIDVDGASEEMLHELGRQARMHRREPDQARGDTKWVLSGPTPLNVPCSEASVEASAVTPSGNTIQWGTVMGFRTTLEKLIRHYTLLDRPGFDAETVEVNCWPSDDDLK
ncbi:hypothetical protein GNI_104310 [Gregarina niphandrodes]|uniref:Uncharacterized protein n=1 Tax=Gregarina niphandrodes TaxID=110365 RepID=A0A023B4G6_GRENI|nr:hypothetical protein GNI_104310 [Gregarina niphandrodes]EZG56365.1 hypothetical protein GNI_104310 [Gregarina niphandrodes]|eukprot:XP_011131294.1 hypothetical protein GNI_104310 [Gregarina niphandrodes]